MPLVQLILTVLTSLTGVIFAINTFSENAHWDIYNYYAGYRVINNGQIFGYLEFFGRPSEIALPIFYFFLSFFEVINSRKDLAIAHALFFWILAPFSLRIFIASWFPNIPKQRIKNLYLLLLFIMPVGWPLQLYRQALSLLLIMLFISILGRKLPIIKIFIFASLTHVANIGLIALLRKRTVIFMPTFIIFSFCSFLFARYTSGISGISNIFVDFNWQPFYNKYCVLLLLISLGSILLTKLTRQSIYNYFQVNLLIVFVNVFTVFFVERIIFGFSTIWLAMFLYNAQYGSQRVTKLKYDYFGLVSVIGIVIKFLILIQAEV